ncbi:MAG: ferritin-like domain-containing protein [Kofleriaceae bacterium]
MMMRDLQHRAVDSIKRRALTLSLHSRAAQRLILQEYLWIEEGAESIALDRIPHDAPWLGKLVARQLADETRHAALLRRRLAELGVGVTRPPPSILRAKLWWLDRVCVPYKEAFEAGDVIVLLAVAAQLEATGVRMFERHLAVLEATTPDDPTAVIIRSILSDERRHMKSCAAAARKLLRDHEHARFDELVDKIAAVDRSFGITISLGFWLNIATAALCDRAGLALALRKLAA